MNFRPKRQEQFGIERELEGAPRFDSLTILST